MLARVPWGRKEAWLSWGVITVLNFTRSPPPADLEPDRQPGDGDNTCLVIVSSRQEVAVGRQEQELKPPAVPVDVAVEASTWNACCRADKPASKASLHTKASQGHCPKGVAWQVASFLPSFPPSPFTDCNNCWRQICSHSQCCCALFPFVKIVIYSVLNFSLLAPQIWHNKTFNVVTAMLQ